MLRLLRVGSTTRSADFLPPHFYDPVSHGPEAAPGPGALRCLHGGRPSGRHRVPPEAELRHAGLPGHDALSVESGTVAPPAPATVPELRAWCFTECAL